MVPTQVPLPKSDRLFRELKNLDKHSPVRERHKVGVVYIAAGCTDKVAILSQRNASLAFERFASQLGTDCCTAAPGLHTRACCLRRETVLMNTHALHFPSQGPSWSLTNTGVMRVVYPQHMLAGMCVSILGHAVLATAVCSGTVPIHWGILYPGRVTI